MNHPRKDLLNISSLTDEEIHTLLDSAGPMKELFTKSVKKVPALKGKSVLTLMNPAPAPVPLLRWRRNACLRT